MIRRILLLPFILVALTSTGLAADIDELKADIQKILNEGNIPGASVALISREGTIWAGGVGKADVAAGKNVTGSTLFRVGSISKSFTALSVLTLVEKGLIDLEAPVRTLAPEIEFSNPWADTHPVTVAMVMEHTTGFDDIHFREYAKSDDPDITLTEGLAFNPKSRSSRWKPGTHMSYCNSGPPIAAYILQKVTGTIFEDYARDNIFAVLGMHDSGYHYSENTDLLAKGYEEDGVTVAHYDHITVRPSGSLNASSNDMANYLRMMINRGNLDGVQLLQPATISRMERPTTTLSAAAGHDFGYRLGNYSSIVNGHHFHGHNGGITGFVSISAYSSELGLAFFVSINKGSSKIGDIAKRIGEYLTEGIDPPQAPSASLSSEELGHVAGYYQNVTPRMEITRVITRFLAVQRVTQENGKLFVKGLFGGENKELIPVTSTSFRFEDQPVATAFLIRNEGGDQMMQGSMGGNVQKVSGLLRVYFNLVGAGATLALLISSLLFALVWVPAKAFGKFKAMPLKPVLVPLLAILSLVAAILLPALLSSSLVDDLGNLTVLSLTLFVGTVLFALLSLLSLFTTFRSRAVAMGRTVRVHTFLVTLACATTLVYLWTSGWIGLRTWAG